MRKHFPNATACSNLHYMGGKPLKQIFGLRNEMDIFIHTELSQRPCNERMASPEDLAVFS